MSIIDAMRAAHEWGQRVEHNNYVVVALCAMIVGLVVGIFAWFVHIVRETRRMHAENAIKRELIRARMRHLIADIKANPDKYGDSNP